MSMLPTPPLAQTPSPITPEEQQLLAQLVDIHMPDPIGLWPPSLGVILIVCVLLVTCTAAVFFIQSYRKQNKYRKNALKAFNEIKSRRSTLTGSELFSELNTLIKRCCITALPASKPHIASLWGHNFYTFLNNTCNQKPNTTKNMDTLLDTWYDIQYSNAGQEHTQSTEIDRYLGHVESWIKHHRKKQIRNTMPKYSTPKGVTHD